jgi:hypothetical protein
MNYRILLSPSKNSKKILDSYCFVTFFLLFIFEYDVNVPSKSNKQKTFFYLFFDGIPILKVNDENSRNPIRTRIHLSEACTDPRIQIRIRIHTKMSWIRNTGRKHPAQTTCNFFKFLIRAPTDPYQKVKAKVLHADPASLHSGTGSGSKSKRVFQTPDTHPDFLSILRTQQR